MVIIAKRTAYPLQILKQIALLLRLRAGIALWHTSVEGPRHTQKLPHALLSINHMNMSADISYHTYLVTSSSFEEKLGIYQPQGRRKSVSFYLQWQLGLVALPSFSSGS